MKTILTTMLLAALIANAQNGSDLITKTATDDSNKDGKIDRRTDTTFRGKLPIIHSTWTTNNGAVSVVRIFEVNGDGALVELDDENDGHFDRFDLYLPGVENAKEAFMRNRDGMIVPLGSLSSKNDKSGITSKTEQKDLDNDGKIDQRLVTFYHDEKKILEVEIDTSTGRTERKYFVQGKEVMYEAHRYRDGRREPFFVIYHPSKDPTEEEMFVRQPNGSVKALSTAEVQAQKKMVAELVKATQQASELMRLKSQSKNDTELVNGLRKAAEGGNSLAMTELGKRYQLGEGIAADPTQAARWYQKAADVGDDEAMLLLAVCYNEGTGLNRDSGKMLMWLRKAAQLGNTRAKAMLDKHPNLK